MSNYENKGILFKNDYKQKDNQPDYKGKINVEGKELELAAWVRKGEKGSFMSLSVSEPYKKDKPTNQTAKESFDDSLSDELPF